MNEIIPKVIRNVKFKVSNQNQGSYCIFDATTNY